MATLDRVSITYQPTRYEHPGCTTNTVRVTADVDGHAFGCEYRVATPVEISELDDVLARAVQHLKHIITEKAVPQEWHPMD